MAFADTAELATRLSLDDKDFQAGMARANRSLSRFESNIGKVGKGTSQIGRGLARVGAIGAIAVGTALAYTAKQAIDFQDAFQGVVKTVSQADLAKAGLTFDDLAKSFRRMATEIPIAATQLAAIGEAAGALGVPAAQIETFTKTVALLSVTTNLTADAAAEDLGKITTILGLTGKGITDFADTLVNLGNQGASTESDIIEVTKRFAAMGKQAGLTTNQILALSSAATSLGAEPEAAGSALSRIFGNMSTEIANGTKKGQEFAKITGKSLKELRKEVNKGQGLQILLDTLKGLKGLSRTESASVLKALGITNVRDRNAILLMAQNLGFVTDQINIANTSAGALGKEATKRFETVASSIQLLKNNFTEAAITVGEGFAPALGRAAKKLTEFLKREDVKTELKTLGEDIGKFIDKIDWNQILDGAKSLVGVLKGAGDAALTLLGIISKLPKEVLAVGGGALVLNKLSGGLLGAGAGNIIGGIVGPLARNLAASIPVFGKNFVQPVFVTNMGVGGIGGGGVPGAAGKGLGLVSKVALVGEAIGLTAAVVATQQEISAASTAQATAIQTQTRDFLAAQPDLQALNTALAGVDKGIADLTSNPLHVLVQGEALDRLRQMREDIQRQIENQPGASQKGGAGKQADDLVTGIAGVSTNVEDVKGSIGTMQGKLLDDSVVARTAQVGATNMGATKTATAALTAGAVVAGAIASKDLSTNVTTNVVVNVTASDVTKQVYIQEQYGPGNGSAGGGPTGTGSMVHD